MIEVREWEICVIEKNMSENIMDRTIVRIKGAKQMRENQHS